MTKYTLFHYFKHKIGLVFIEHTNFVVIMKEISTIVMKFLQPWVVRVARFCMSAQNGIHESLQIVIFSNQSSNCMTN